MLASARNGEFDPDGILAQVAPSDAGDAATRHWWSMFMNSAATPPEAVDEITSHGPVDIRRLWAPCTRRPSCCTDRRPVRRRRGGRYLAAHLPRARLVELPGDDHLPFAGDQESVLTATEEFLTGTTRVAATDRAVLTVMFTDIVGSTELPAGSVTAVGAVCWRSTTRWSARS